MWAALGATAVFVVILLLWWGILSEAGDTIKYNKTMPIGVVCITAVYIALLFIHYRY